MECLTFIARYRHSWSDYEVLQITPIQELRQERMTVRIAPDR